MPGPLVSVITPAYDAQRFIETNIRSVHAQQYRPMEHLIVDDGSRDSTAQIARNLADDLASPGYEIRVVGQPRNMGAASALDKGLELSRGELVCWLSADDAYVSAEKVSGQVRLLRADPHAAGTFDWITATGASPESARQVTARWPRFMELLPSLRRMNPVHVLIGLLFHNPVNGTSVMLRRDWLSKSGGFDTDLGNFDADADLWMRIHALGGRLVGRREAGTFYRVHPGQTSNDLAGMARGTSLTRLRMIQALDQTDMLAPTLERVTDLLLLARMSRAHWLRPQVTVALVRSGLPTASGVLARSLRGMLHDLEGNGLVDEVQLAEWSTAARSLQHTPAFGAFCGALQGAAQAGD